MSKKKNNNKIINKTRKIKPKVIIFITNKLKKNNKFYRLRLNVIRNFII